MAMLTCICICQLSFEGVQGCGGARHADVGGLHLLPGPPLPFASTSRSRLEVIQAGGQAGLGCRPGLGIGTGRRLQSCVHIHQIRILPKVRCIQSRVAPCTFPAPKGRVYTVLSSSLYVMYTAADSLRD